MSTLMVSWTSYLTDLVYMTDRGLCFVRNPYFWWMVGKGSTGQVGCLEFDCSFSSTWQKTNQKKTLVPRLTLRVSKPGDEAAPYAAMRCCKACSSTHNLMIAALLASHYALPGSIILAASSGFSGRSMRKLASFKQSAHFFRPCRRCSARVKGGVTPTDQDRLKRHPWAA